MDLCTNCKTAEADAGRKTCSVCRKKNSEAQAKWKNKQPNKNALYLRVWNQKRRKTVIEHYGGKCICCGEDTFQFLAIDHKHGGGTQHRKETKMQGSNMVNWIIKNNFPDDFQIKCHNCNQAVGYYGVCPHQEGKVIKMFSEMDE